MSSDEFDNFYWSLATNDTELCWANELDPNDRRNFCGPNALCADKGLLLPFFLEVTWPRWARAVLYFVALLYSFLGVSIVADIFMCAIEKITSKTKRINIASAGNGDENTPEVIEVPVWNNTVANLTLMALGSSAPEILLSCIEIIFNNFEAGELGPGTIVGSAAFNLFAISAVCISAIPSGETRRIDMIGVFGVTASFSVFAYIWLLIILKAWSPEEVTLVEAVITFALFPVLVLIAYAADKKWYNYLFCRGGSSGSHAVANGADDKQRQIELGSFTPGESTYIVPLYFRRSTSSSSVDTTSYPTNLLPYIPVISLHLPS